MDLFIALLIINGIKLPKPEEKIEKGQEIIDSIKRKKEEGIKY